VALKSHDNTERKDGVRESAVRADEQHAGMARLAASRRWRDLIDGDADAEGA
jgi:hypothetical protein